MVSPVWVATAMSGVESAFRLVTMTPWGAAPTFRGVPAPNVPSPLLRKTTTSSVLIVITTMSLRPSPLKSPVAFPLC